jgi:hypothetical protein
MCLAWSEGRARKGRRRDENSADMRHKRASTERGEGAADCVDMPPIRIACNRQTWATEGFQWRQHSNTTTIDPTHDT